MNFCTACYIAPCHASSLFTVYKLLVTVDYSMITDATVAASISEEMPELITVTIIFTHIVNHTIREHKLIEV